MFDMRIDSGISVWDGLGFGSSEAVEADRIRSELWAREAEIARLRAEQVELLRGADRLQLDTADGSRSMTDWVVAELDVSPQTAHRMMRIARSHQADIEAGMTAGVYGLDRAVFLCQLRELDSPEQVITDQHQYSLGHLYGLIEKLRRISRADEQSTFEDRYLVLQSSLDCSGGRFWGQTQGADWESISRAVDTRESSLPVLPTQSVGQRRVDALASICLDSLTGTRSSGEENRAVMVAEVFVDAALAAQSHGEAGVTLSSGPRVGPNTLAEILCTGKVRLIVQGEDGKPIGVSDRGEAIPPAVRLSVLHRDQGRCQIDGCHARYRLQPHHIQPRSEGGHHHLDNLITLCWYHHHVAIHMMGMNLDPTSPPHRKRLTWHNHGPPGLS
jgi:5-methylcytosine-specific restriction endonuclease McrA